MKTARAHRKFAIYSNFLDTILEGEEDIQDGETRKEVMKRILAELEETAAELRKEAESMRGEIIHETFAGMKRDSPPIGPPMPQRINETPIEINIQDEKILIAIENARTRDQLFEIKEKYPVMKVGVNAEWNNKMAELTVPKGDENNFTDGLD